MAAPPRIRYRHLSTDGRWLTRYDKFSSRLFMSTPRWLHCWGADTLIINRANGTNRKQINKPGRDSTIRLSSQNSSISNTCFYGSVSSFVFVVINICTFVFSMWFVWFENFWYHWPLCNWRVSVARRKMALRTYGDKPISFQVEENGEYYCIGSEVRRQFSLLCLLKIQTFDGLFIISFFFFIPTSGR